MRAFPELTPFRFRVHATRVLVLVFLFISGHACSLVVIAVRSFRPQRSSLPSLGLEKKNVAGLTVSRRYCRRAGLAVIIM